MSTPSINDLHYGELAGHETLIDEASATVTYIGKANPGVATSASLWSIKKIDSTSNPTTIKYANSDNSFDKIWDNRATYTY